MTPVYQTTKGGDYALDTHRVIGWPEAVEMHLSRNPSLPKRFGKAIKAAGGRYNNCRGDSWKRYVTLPLTVENRSLINRLLREYGRTGPKGTTVIARGTGIDRAPSQMVVGRAPYVGENDSPLRHWEERYWQKVVRAAERGEFALSVGTPPEPTLAERKDVAERIWSRADDRVKALEQSLEKARADEREAFAHMRALQAEARGEKVA